MSDDSTKGCYAALAIAVAIPLSVWIEAHAMALAWNGILRHYVPMLPLLSLWGAWAVHLAARILARGIPLAVWKDDRERKDFYALWLVAAPAWAYAVVWIVVRYVVGAP